jgi:ribosomal protein L11 methyltransferase
MAYLAYKFTVKPAQPGSEILTAVIADMGFESFDTLEDGFIAYLPEQANDQVHLEGIAFDDFHFSYTIERIEQENWNEEWEKNFEPVEVGDLLLIRAPFHAANPRFKEEIVIMPKMSFGTGHHQTTRLMCQQLFETPLKNKRVLDMGCGTAILAILAKKLGAAEVLGIDIDDWSVENGIENCVANGFQEIEIIKGDVDALLDRDAFDCIIANINKNVLKAHMSTYAKKLNPGGQLFLSGFFMTDVAELTAVCAAQGLSLTGTRNENEWAMMALVRAL